jgi:AraC-like DNA-binding protein
MYREWPVHADPYDLYACVWTRATGAPRDLRVVPDACIDVIWHRESGELFVAGPDTRAHVAVADPGTLIGLRFSAGSGPAALGVPADVLRDGRFALDELWRPAAVRRLAGSLARAGSDAQARRVLAGGVAANTTTDRDRVASGVLRLLRSGRDIGSIAAAVGLSERQLHRRCLAAFGYGAKVLHRVLRFHRAVRLAYDGVAFADIAYGVGYADQAHLSREVKALAGVPLARLTRSALQDPGVEQDRHPRAGNRRRHTPAPS